MLTSISCICIKEEEYLQNERVQSKLKHDIMEIYWLAIFTSFVKDQLVHEIDFLDENAMSNEKKCMTITMYA